MGAATWEIPRDAHGREGLSAEALAHSPFAALAQAVQPQSPLRAAITAAYRRPEPEMLAWLLPQARLPDGMAQATQAMAQRLAQALREGKVGHNRAGLVQSLLQEFSLSSEEGVALMCLAEALLRIPDAATRDALIRDKIGPGHWQAHLGHSPSLFVNAATWGLAITGRLVRAPSPTGLTAALRRVVGASGAPVVRKAVDMAMRLMGAQFVAGQTMAEALAHAQPWEQKGFCYSYDMLGEAALTEADAAAYFEAYANAIDAIGQAAKGRGIYDGPGISIKLSALYPRYCRSQREAVMAHLYPRLLALAVQARQGDIGLNIDAEEADRLDLSLDLLERLCFEPLLRQWDGLGFVVQAYQKRAPLVLDALVDLAQRSGRRLMVRLVKGAYWDSEIKRAQAEGLDGYPVYTRKVYTDVAYLACARKLLAAPQWIYPQFATHNAQTLSAIYHLAGPDYQRSQYEFQCLHGMGESLYAQVVGATAEGHLNRPCRIYAPVGSHETLLAYLVRRLLENGANTSFVHRIADASVPIEALVADPVAEVEALAAQEGALGLPHPRIPLPAHLYGAARRNCEGFDGSNEASLAGLAQSLLQHAHAPWLAEPMLASAACGQGGQAAGAQAALSTGAAEAVPEPFMPICNPARPSDVVGHVRSATLAQVGQAVQAAQTAGVVWSNTPAPERAAVLECAADLMQAQRASLVGLLVREAGKTYSNAVAEWREAIDFLRYYAAQVRALFANDSHHPLGTVVCISPWNFPLAIFTGQVAAALAAGNRVLAKPAEQTPLIAAKAVELLWQAGVPTAALQLLPGAGESIGAALVADARIRAVVFTGSTAVAQTLNRATAGRLDAQGQPVVLVAETGGINAMVVDASALTEQVVADVLASAFDSAGQRCSALRLLCLQEDVAERTLTMLRGAMAQLRMGDPAVLSTDVGPVIDGQAHAAIAQHIAAMREDGHAVFQAACEAGGDAPASAAGTFIVPTVIELASVQELTREIFGPVLHVVRFSAGQLDALVQQINALGYGLTLGLHTRMDAVVAGVATQAHVGNLYVNRNMVGAVVGVQPFGGEALSGTGPKAGGPLYLYRLLAARPASSVQAAMAGAGEPVAEQGPTAVPENAAVEALVQWAHVHGQPSLAAFATHCAAWFSTLGVGQPGRLLPGPTGERNTYAVQARARVLCEADDVGDALTQVAAVLALNAQVLWAPSKERSALYRRLPAPVQAHIVWCTQGVQGAEVFDAVLHHGSVQSLAQLAVQVAERPGPIVAVHAHASGSQSMALERLLLERAISVNTAAAGGNTSLMTMG